jgi:acetyl-CoA carboxylase biotin carboxylase subunit
MGIETVAVYSTADENSLHVRFADEAVCIGPPAARDSYLHISSILSAARISGAEAIHPGYGFMAENADFAEICADNNLVFIGPTAKAIKQMGDKAFAKRTMTDAGVPVLPGSKGTLASMGEALPLIKEMGFPVILKATAGGGGKGMRIVPDAESFEMQYMMASNEAEQAFGNGALYIEKYISRPRHVEVQVLADRHGRVVHLGERDCSIQRRHQKLIEESPSPAISEETRRLITEAAVRGVSSIEYEGAGTVEFLLDEDGRFYFMEMNARVQVEHPVTEAVSGIDIIREQISIAAGNPALPQPDGLHGHAIECRINAEDPSCDFRPSPGTITSWHAPGGYGIRIDSHAYQGYQIPPYYDSLLAKVIAYGATREETIRRMERALDEFVIEGVHTTIPFHKAVLRQDDFRSGNYDTHYLESHSIELD